MFFSSSSKILNICQEPVAGDAGFVGSKAMILGDYFLKKITKLISNVNFYFP